MFSFSLKIKLYCNHFRSVHVEWYDAKMVNVEVT